MEINKIAKNEAEEIRERINLIPVEGCIDAFVYYMHGGSKNSFEQKFIHELYQNSRTLEKKLVRLKYANFSTKELIEQLEHVEIEGVYSLDSRDGSDEVVHWYEYFVSCAEFNPIMKEYMHDILNKLVHEENRTLKEKELQALKTTLMEHEAKLTRCNQNRIDLKESIAKTKERLKELEY